HWLSPGERPRESGLAGRDRGDLSDPRHRPLREAVKAPREGRAVLLEEAVAVRGIIDSRHSLESRRDAPQDAGLGGVGVDDVRALGPQDAPQGAEGLQVLEGRDLADELRDVVGAARAARALPVGLRVAAARGEDEDRLEAPGVKAVAD